MTKIINKIMDFNVAYTKLVIYAPSIFWGWHTSVMLHFGLKKAIYEAFERLVDSDMD